MPSQPEAGFGITEARRILGEVFAPWVQDLNLSVERLEHTPPRSEERRVGKEC